MASGGCLRIEEAQLAVMDIIGFIRMLFYATGRNLFIVHIRNLYTMALRTNSYRKPHHIVFYKRIRANAGITITNVYSLVRRDAICLHINTHIPRNRQRRIFYDKPHRESCNTNMAYQSRMSDSADVQAPPKTYNRTCRAMLRAEPGSFCSRIFQHKYRPGAG